MHELALTEGILKIAAGEAEKHRVKRVVSIRLKVGELSGVVPALIQEYFNIVSRGTAAEGASIIVEKVPGVVGCLDCGEESKIEKMRLKCSKCGGYNVKIISGREYYVDSLEVE